MASNSQLMQSLEPIRDMVLVMGVTGAGKSHFINRLSGMNSTQEFHGLESGETALTNG